MESGRCLLLHCAGSSSIQTVSGFCGSEEASGLRVVGKILLKAFSQNKKASKTFTLRNLPLASINSVNQLKTEIKRQLQSDVNEDFDVGYLEGSTQISFSSSHDLSGIWSDVSKGKKVTLWCDGLKEHEQEKRCLRADEDQEELLHPAKKRKSKATDEKRDSVVEDTVQTLKENHGKSFTAMQYRIWAEMIVGDLHDSIDDPPNTSMFSRAGNSGNKKKLKNSLTEALTVVATKLSSSPSPTRSRTSGGSPARLIDNRSKCYKQLNELTALKSNGVLTDEEYMCEKAAVMATLKKLPEGV